MPAQHGFVYPVHQGTEMCEEPVGRQQLLLGSLSVSISGSQPRELGKRIHIHVMSSPWTSSQLCGDLFLGRGGDHHNQWDFYFGEVGDLLCCKRITLKYFQIITAVGLFTSSQKPRFENLMFLGKFPNIISLKVLLLFGGDCTSGMCFIFSAKCLQG